MLETLPNVRAIARRDEAKWLAGIRLIGLTDVASPLTGANGTSQIFGAQKGLKDLDAADRLVSNLAKQLLPLMSGDYSSVEGAGAAGGLGFAVRVLGGLLQPGADFILDALQLNHSAMNFDWVIPGEGRSDGQTLLGKGPALIASLAKRQGIPVTLLSGAVDHSAALSRLFDGCFSIQSAPVTLEHAVRNAGALLEVAACNLATLFAKASQIRCERGEDRMAKHVDEGDCDRVPPSNLTDHTVV
ncbi:glycerate kinase [Glaciimonas sp. PCH181]|uniref:glycerate kinase n=1 Tax=Glaciimonas sp. PCH181 TaxID=2133943 RepID=UPI001375248E|nr:glycerate kinase [Glaciimonas sp. PCH181]